MSKSTTILHVCETAQGGVATYLNNFCRYTDSWSKNKLLVPAHHIEHIYSKETSIAFWSKKRGFFSLLSLCIVFLRVRASVKPDVIVFHSTFSLLTLFLSKCSLTRSKTVYIPHGWSLATVKNKHSMKAWLYKTIEGSMCGLADVVINVGLADLQIAQKFSYFGTHVLIENAVPDIEEHESISVNDKFDHSALNVLFVGRFDHQKGIDILLRAYENMSKKRPDMVLHLVGDRVRGQNIKIPNILSIKSYGWRNQSELNSLYKICDVLVVPSRWEGFGLVIPEALRAGTPVICSKASNLPDLIEEGKSGLSFELEVEHLESLLVTINKEQLSAMRASARKQYFERFTIGRWEKELKTLFEGLVGDEIIK